MRILSITGCLLLLALSSPCYAADADASEADVEALRQEYWARGEEDRALVVQNRKYPKHHNFEIGLSGGLGVGDGFLHTYLFGGTVGFHVSELISIHLAGAVASTSASDALQFVQGNLGSNANTNPLKSILGGELRANLFYGKFSMLGNAITYFDTYLVAGVSSYSTESGSGMGFSFGAIQQFHLTSLLALNFDLRLQRYGETLVDKVPTSPTRGQALGSHNNLTVTAGIGISVFLDPLGANEAAVPAAR